MADKKRKKYANSKHIFPIFLTQSITAALSNLVSYVLTSIVTVGIGKKETKKGP